MRIICYGDGNKQMDGNPSIISKIPAKDRVVTFWHKDTASTKALLDRCKAAGISALVQCEDWSVNHMPDWARTGAFITDHAAHPAFAGFYFDEPGIAKPAAGLPASQLARHKALLTYIHTHTNKPTIAVFGLFTEIRDGFAGLASVEGVDNYWNDPWPGTRSYREYTDFVAAFLDAHRATGYAGQYVSVAATYARPMTGGFTWVASYADMRKTHEYLASRVGDRLTWAMLWAYDTGSTMSMGYGSSEAALAQTQQYVAWLEIPSGQPRPDDVIVKLKPGQRAVITAE